MADREEQPRSWVNYYETTKDNPPQPLLVQAVSLLDKTGTALDLGCGAGNGTRYLLEQGFIVTAVDADQNAEGFLRQLPNQDHLNFIVANFETFQPESYDLVSAQYALPFNPKDTFRQVVERIKGAINSGGIFTGQLFGVNDTWNKPDTKMTFHTKEEAKELFEDMEILEFKEDERDATDASGTPKHWHVFHIIAKKPG